MRTRAVVNGLALPAVAAGLVIAAACGGDDGGNGPVGGGPSVTRERAGIRLTLSVDKDRYGLGAPVMVAAEAENISGESIAFSVRLPNESPIKLRVVNDLTRSQPLASATGAGGVQPGEVFEVDASVKHEAQWQQQINTYQTPVQAPPGKYTITAEFLVATVSEQIPVRAAVSIQLEGGKPVVSSKSAIGTALLQDEVKEWFKGREMTVICLDGNADLFYNGAVETGSVAETLDVLYDNQVNAGLPICSPVTDGEEWLILFSSQTGPPPKVISAFVDLHTGNFLRLEVGGPTPRPQPPTPAAPTP